MLNQKIIILIIFLLFSCTAKKEKLSFWIGGAPQEIMFWESLINDFEKEYGTDVEFVRQPTYTDQRRQGLITSLVAKQTDPDVFLMDVVWIKQFVESGWLEPLDKYIRQGNFPVQAFFKRVIDLSDRYEGTLYALPVFIDIGLLYYRTDLLRKYNFPGPPKTWNRLVQYSVYIQKQERKNNPNFNGFVWQGAQYEGLVCNLLEYMYSHGGGIYDNGSIGIYQEANVRALKLMQDLIHGYSVSPLNTYTGMKEEEVRRSFQRGNALFERNWLYAWNLHQSENSAVKGKTGIGPLPGTENHSYVSMLGGWHIGMSAYSDQKENAWKLVQYILSFRIQKKMLLKVGWFPGQKNVYKDKEIERKMPHLKKLQEVFEHAVSRPNLSYYTQVSDVIQRYVNKCLANRIKPEKALKDIEKELKSVAEIYEK